MKFNMEDRMKVKEEVETNVIEAKHALSTLQNKFGNVKYAVCDLPNLHELICAFWLFFFLYNQCFGNVATSL
jgi:hypothetical protein